MKEEKFELKVGAGTIRVYAGDEGYGQVNIDLVVERNGESFSLPIAVVENPNDPEVTLPDSTPNATTVYVYRTLDDCEYTDKIVIPDSCIDDAVAAC